ncbi:hypothetical protein H1R20_g11520, partial [Candolleomyces eurysporus]
MLRDVPAPLFNFPPARLLTRVPDKSGSKIKPLSRRPPPQQQFITECGFYVAQARGEGPDAEEHFLKTFLDMFYKRWPGMKSIHEGMSFYTAEHGVCMLASELSWAATWCSQIVPSLHWEQAFQLDLDTWDIEAAKNQQHLERRKRARASAPLKVRQPSTPAVSVPPARPILKRLPKNMRPNKPCPGASLQTAIDVDMLDENNLEEGLRELEERMIIQAPAAKGRRIVPKDLTFF